MASNTGARGAEVRVEPLGVTIQTRPGEPLMQAARRYGLRWPTICNGAALCGFCYVSVLEAEGELPPISTREKRGLACVEPPFDQPGTRLACQLVLSGKCVVERKEVQRA